MICPACSSEKLENGERRGIYTLQTCKDCQVQFWEPLKHPGKEFYETSELHKIEGKKSLQWRHRQFLNNPPIVRGKLLDIACGTGEFLNAAGKIGFDVWGIDISSQQIEAAKEFFNLKNVFTDVLENFVQRKDAPKFDIVTFFEVLEHLDNPRDFLDKIKKVLRPDGFIVFSVPNSERLGMGRESEEVPPNHLFRWNAKSVSNFLSLQGFEIIKIVIQPFSKEFFFTTGFFSFGLIRRLKQSKKAKNSLMINKHELRSFTALSSIAKIKNAVLAPVAWLLAFFPRFLGYKYWDLYIIAKLK